ELIDKLETDRRVDSMVKESIKDALLDTAGLYTAPVKVVKAYLVTKEYSNYKDIAITFKNISNKTIDAISFSWYGETAFHEPADMGTSIHEGFGGGFDDDAIGPGKTRTSQWSILSNNAKKVILAWPTKVAFSDGTKWELR
ncbi:MAG TPA: hypothetical protein VHM26_02585, partial [Chitinophagaceae bacterium]|nr:hypothetical protein [Chitinophagaceae bacterium]